MKYIKSFGLPIALLALTVGPLVYAMFMLK